MAEQEQENPLQKRVDNLKTLSLLNNLHNLNPPTKEDSRISDIMVVEALKVSPRLQEVYLEIRGQVSDHKGNVVQISRPIMNELGAFKFITIIKHIAEEVEYANYDEDELPGRIVLYYELNYPYFTLWNKEYDLNPMDFNYVSSLLLSFIDTSFHKAKHGHFARILTKTYAEKTLDKAISSETNNKKRGGFLSRLLNK